jgi:uncharacterized protein YndB with AHSA1/START domain
MVEAKIEREIEISASAEQVWTLVSEPGWWINDGKIVEHRIERRDDHDLVHDPVHGEFAIATLAVERPRYVRFGWLSREPEATPEQRTIVEFWIDDRPAGGVVLRVMESGFDTLPGSDADRQRAVEDNTQGWQVELGAAQQHLQSQE